LVSHRDDVWVLNLRAELAGAGGGWTLTHRGQSAPELSGCSTCDVRPGRCRGCPDTMMYLDDRNNYSSATAFGCGVLSTFGSLQSTPGLARFRLFEPTLAGIFEWPMPTYDWPSTGSRSLSSRVFAARAATASSLELGNFGWGIVVDSSVDDSAPMRIVVLRR
jgi:hypothetical protein